MAAPKVHVVGILGTVDVEASEDRWMAIDFAIMRDLFSEADSRAWFSAIAIDEGDWPIIIGDPHSERLKLSAASLLASPVRVVPLTSLKSTFLQHLSHIAAQPADTIIIVLCGHGKERTGDLVLGGEMEDYMELLTKLEVEDSLKLNVIPRNIFLLSIACYSGHWRSSYWTLFAAADEDQTSAAMSTSGSGEGRGSVFTYALLAQRADEHGLTAPHPVRKVDPPGVTYAKGPVVVWDTPVSAKMHEQSATAKIPRPSPQQAHAFMESLRTTMGGTYSAAEFILQPPSILPSELPLRPFTSNFLTRLQVVDASPPPDAQRTNTPKGAVAAVPTSMSNIDPLTSAEKSELILLASEYSAVERPNVAIDVAINLMAAQLARGDSLQSQAQEHILLAKLRYRKRDSLRASAITDYFSWKPQGTVEEWARGNGLVEMLEAEAHGAAIATEFFLGVGVGARWGDATKTSVNSNRRPWKTMGPGAWLADTWIAAGRPTVEKVEWNKAVAHANTVVGVV
ncbi:hypothetical protein B0H12DRAFT_1095883 [Mycena haematopus]|nr:hypothetical protein B0H12DRAFT_1095883 [Mycena haematopus]